MFCDYKSTKAAIYDFFFSDKLLTADLASSEGAKRRLVYMRKNNSSSLQLWKIESIKKK